jgi:ribosome-associated translation inhibitor RaiA
MQFTLHVENLNQTTSFKTEVADLMQQSVRQFGPRIRKMQMNICDLNGPRGGADKRCRCVVYLHRMAPIVIEETAENLRGLLYRVSDRVAYRLGQRIDRLTKRSRSRKSRTQSQDAKSRSELAD